MDKSNVYENKYMFLYCLFAILPTIILGIFADVKEYKTIIWIWDVLIILIFFAFNAFRVKKISKSSLIMGSLFLFIIALQYITYSHSLQTGLVQELYTVLPIVYFIHFTAIFILLTNVKVEKFDAIYFFKYFLYFVIISCIYNILKNYQYIFNINNITSKYINISSFFSQRNAFGQLLFLGTICNMYILEVDKKKKWYVSAIFILMNLIFSFSRTAIFSTCIFLIIHFILKNANVFKKSNFIKIGIVTLIFIIAFCLVLSSESVMNFLEYYVLRSEDGITRTR